MKKLTIIFLLAFLTGFVSIYAQDKKITQLPALPSVTGNEYIPLAVSGINYYTTPNQLKSWLNILSLPYVPLSGTTNSDPITKTFEFRQSGGTSTFWVDTVDGTSYIGLGNKKDLSSASIFSRTKYNRGTKYEITSELRDGTNDAYLILKYTGNELAYSNGTYKSYFDQTGTTMFFQSIYPSFKGTTYEITTIPYINANYDSTSIIHEGLIKRLITAATSTITTGTVIGTSPITVTSGTVVGLNYGTGLALSSGSLVTSAIPNSALSNSTFTVNGTAMALGTSSTVTSAAGTLTGTGLNSTVITSSLTTVGTVTAGIWNSNSAPPVSTVATASLITINTDAYNMYTVTSLSTATTFTAPTGTPKTGQGLIIRIKDNGTSRGLTFTTGANGFRFSSDAPAPTTTTLSKVMYLYFLWNEVNTTWDCTGWRDNY